MKHWGVSARLLSCASALALGGAMAGGAAAHPNQPTCTSLTHPTTIAGDKKCVRVTKTIAGNVVNNAKIGKPPGDKDAAFFIGDGGLITGTLVNNGKIEGGEGTDALLLGKDANVAGGIFNNGTILAKDGSGIALGYVDRVYSHGHWYNVPKAVALTGDIVNGGVVDGEDYGVAARYGTMTGTLINKAYGKIEGDKAGVYIADSFGEWTGGIENSGLIKGGFAGIQIGDFGEHDGDGGEHGNESYGESDDSGGVVFSGGISNTTSGAIVGESGPSIAVGGASFSGGIYNDGLITQYLSDGGEGGEHHYWGGEGGESHSPYEGVGIVVATPTFEGGIFNDTNGEIYGKKGPAIWITDKTGSFAGGIANNGLIAGADDAIRIESTTFAGGLYNGAWGSIASSKGDAIFAGTEWTGDVANHGLISGAHNGFTYVGSSFDGAFTNTGLIEGGATGVSITAATVSGPFSNSGSITGGWGDGVAIDVDTWGAADARADIVNAAGGVIVGGETGFLLDVATMYGDFVNDGQISGYGENTGVHVIAGDYFGDFENNGTIDAPSNALVLDIEYFDGAFSNTGTIAGGQTGAQFILGEMTGGFTNSGLIVGEYGNGVDIAVETWGSEEAPVTVLNASGGVIVGGETGFLLDVATMHGDFVNDGQIAGYGENTGVHVIAGDYLGDFENNGTIDAPSNALVLDIDRFDGAFSNTGTIEGGQTGAQFILGEMTGGFTNSGTIVGAYGNGVDIYVEAWGAEDAPAAIVNTGTGLVAGGEIGFELDAGTLHGSFANNGSIEGGETGASFRAENFDAPFANSGVIGGGANGVVMMLGQASGGFTNSGTIAGEYGDGVDIVVTNWGAADAPADIVNATNGTISGGADGLSIDLVTFHGDVTNDGLMEGANIAALITGGTFDGAFENTGEIEGGVTGVALDLETVTGAFTNSGSITGEYGDGVAIHVDAWGAADARADVVNTADGVIVGGQTGFLLDVGAMYGDFVNDGQIAGYGENTGVHVIAGDYFGDILNNGTIEALSNALTAEIEVLDGAFANTGTIAGGQTGAQFVLGEMTGGFANSGTIAGEYGNGVDIYVEAWGTEDAPAAIVNTVDGRIAGGATGFALDAGTLHGSFTNDGRIEGGVTGASFRAENFDAPFAVSGVIAGGADGVVMVLEQASGGFTNSGSITGEYGTGVDIVVTSWGAADARANLVNTATGTISGGADGLSLDLVTFHGDVTNDGLIEGGEIAALIAGGTFDGAFENTGSIEGGATGVFMSLETVTGPFTNSGSIAGVAGDGVAINVGAWGAAETRTDIVNTADGVITGGETGFLLVVGSIYGDFVNDGLIAGNGENTGVHIVADDFVGDIVNNETIEAPSNALIGEIGTLDGDFINTGDIAGGETGAQLILGQMTGDFTNSGSISGETGNGVDIVVTSWGAVEARADIVNTVDGVITAGVAGFSLDLVTFHGDVTNDGLIEGGEVAALISGGTFDGAFENTGDIQGGATGVAMNLQTVTGGFTNSGVIAGDVGAGVAIAVAAWGSEGASADIVNTAAGVITGGETGFLLDVGTMYGDVLNDGRISGGGETTGLHIIASAFFGDILNNGTIDAPSNALIAEIGTLDGEIVNTGTIAASDVAVALNIGNGATFTNTGGGLILGDVLFGGEAAYDFVGEDGGVEGNLVGGGNDDTITVQNGTQYFVLGAAGNFASFTVESGGAAIVGARFEGDPAGSGYTFDNVGALAINNGGTLYVDKSSTLNVSSLTQQAGGTVEFYLGAPGGAGFSDLTGTVVAAAGDYGQILVDGAVSLDGAVVGFLDPAFASANPGLDQVRYEDVIVAGGGISGDFSNVALIADSSIFELDEIIDGNTVDMRVSRTSLANVGDLSGIIVNTGGPFDAMVSDRSNGLGSGSCGLAGDGWCFNRFAANEPGATQVMTDATPDDPFAWLRTGYRKEGETAVWGRAIGVWGETNGDGGNAGSEFEVVGAIAGIDHVFTPVLMAGLAAQWTTTEIDFVGRQDNADVDSFELGAYGSWGDTRLYLNANASVIWHSIEVNRFSPTGRALGDYDGTTYSVFAEAGKTFETEEGTRIQPFLALSYSHLDTGGYGEIGTGTLLNVSSSTFDSLKSTIGARVAFPIELESGRKMVPEFRLAWAHEFMDDQASFVATIQGQPPAPSVIRGERFARDTAVVGGGITVPLSDSSSLFVDYDANLNTDITTHTVSAGIRLTW